MERRVLLAVTLSFLVLLLYQALVPSPPRRPAQAGTPTPPAAGAEAPAAPGPDTAAGAIAEGQAPVAPQVEPGSLTPFPRLAGRPGAP